MVGSGRIWRAKEWRQGLRKFCEERKERMRAAWWFVGASVGGSGQEVAGDGAAGGGGGWFWVLSTGGRGRL